MEEKDIILKVENVSKQYRLGLVGTGTISHDLNRWWSKLRGGKQDPYLKVGESNDRSTKGSSEYVWALKDINFEVKRGEVLGIIGKNGAGKSTLLKILSKVTGPTTGEIKTRGRIASLLEVGTGFHGEMTGRENIFLNGAILGMTKKEITAKIDEIIDFSGCQRYIDTPVKRYSSGMTVRLAFAVAAFLEPEILVIDEVLAVGDAEFQKKAIGKMQDISRGDGRTVLFVSHNMAAIQSLCTRVLLIQNGVIANPEGYDADVAVEKYLLDNKKDEIIKKTTPHFNVKVNQKNNYTFSEAFKVNLDFENLLNEEQDVFIDFAVVNQMEDFVLHYKMDFDKEPVRIKKGTSNLLLNIDNPGLILGEYSIIIYIYNRMKNVLYWVENSSSFQISNMDNQMITTTKIKSQIIPKVEIEYS
ncbi:teichoic acid export ATP-binding protein TagH [Algibacter lectus]|uniref:Teichoic acid export ATP-binding protein TagH n=1 Tax=Algibacter lectus TaxID=221126 RepID=A0A090X6S7_9FLAO|nr:ABC transporter ATP-binding protein [Algibacter lectus]GAL81802.1 teichoic acid export ATP-binding protein TagH [Algibacter lectus]